MNTVDSFIDYISKLETPDLASLNMYHGSSKEAEVRRENLRFYLNEMKRIDPKYIFIGEAPGRWGCFLTGIPFTDENTMVNNPFFKGECKLISEIIPHKEASASVIWECLNRIEIEKYPLMWNIYPFHPSNVDSNCSLPEERGNRPPSRQECDLGKDILKRLLSVFNIQCYYAVGCKSRDKLKAEYCNIQYIRHPSRGGANIFRGQFAKIYNL